MVLDFFAASGRMGIRPSGAGENNQGETKLVRLLGSTVLCPQDLTPEFHVHVMVDVILKINSLSELFNKRYLMSEVPGPMNEALMACLGPVRTA